jgi:hypothetical protein
MNNPFKAIGSYLLGDIKRIDARIGSIVSSPIVQNITGQTAAKNVINAVENLPNSWLINPTVPATAIGNDIGKTLGTTAGSIVTSTTTSFIEKLSTPAKIALIGVGGYIILKETGILKKR